MEAVSTWRANRPPKRYSKAEAPDSLTLNKRVHNNRDTHGATSTPQNAAAHQTFANATYVHFFFFFFIFSDFDAKKRGARKPLPCRPKLQISTSTDGQHKTFILPGILLRKLVRTSISFHITGTPPCLPSPSPFSLLSSLRIGKAACLGEWTWNTRQFRARNGDKAFEGMIRCSSE